MKAAVIAFCLMMLMVFSELGSAQYTAEYCSSLQNDIKELQAKILTWEINARSPQKIMVQFQCQPNEDIRACEIRCAQRMKGGDCITVKGSDGTRIWVAIDAYQLEGHPQFEAFKANSQNRKDNVLGAAAGDTGLLPAWRKELQGLQDLYRENCSSAPKTPKGPSLFDRTY